MSEAWSREEVEAAVADYFTMLGLELRRLPFNKAEHNRQLQRLLPNRPKGSIERKHQNISAILIQLGCPYISGYKPLRNYQQLLRNVVEDRLREAAALQRIVAVAVETPISNCPTLKDLLGIEVACPVTDPRDTRLYEGTGKPAAPSRKNYLEIEARNQSLGRAGEELVLAFEHERLWRAGRRALADRIEHVSRTQGDHLGYDVLSFEAGGGPRLIEVKTTRFGALTPFFASRNEVDVSQEREQDYRLYRLFSFGVQPKLFVLTGSLRQTCELEPASFAALPK
ncbi:MAG: DUF3883 domain-containing protein [Verrucomicrobiales bacterium]|nr:DUF3883 domain-containing protein [Verrucomicrobiales bacterium]